jgi:hypothetical protein
MGRWTLGQVRKMDLRRARAGPYSFTDPVRLET